MSLFYLNLPPSFPPLKGHPPPPFPLHPPLPLSDCVCTCLRGRTMLAKAARSSPASRVPLPSESKLRKVRWMAPDSCPHHPISLLSLSLSLSLDGPPQLPHPIVTARQHRTTAPRSLCPSTALALLYSPPHHPCCPPRLHGCSANRFSLSLSPSPSLSLPPSLSLSSQGTWAAGMVAKCRTSSRLVTSCIRCRSTASAAGAGSAAAPPDGNGSARSLWSPGIDARFSQRISP